MKNILKKLALIVLSIFVSGSIFTCPVAAANVCKQISGKSTQETTFIVNTGSRWYSSKDVIKFTQTKGTMKTSDLKLTKSVASTRVMYEYYTVTVKKMSGSKTVNTKTYTWTGASQKIKLDRNSTYKVTVTPYSVDPKYKDAFTYGALFNPYTTFGLWAPRGWKKAATWKVSATSGILSCK